MSSRTASHFTLEKTGRPAERGGNATFRRLLLSTSGASFLLLVAGFIVFPSMLAGPSARPSLIGCLALLLLYLVLGVRGPRAVDWAGYVALRRGLFCGRVLGAIWVIQYIGLNVYRLSDQARLAVTLVVYLAVFGGSSLAGLFSARDTGRLSSGVLAGLWSGVLSSSLVVSALLVMAYLFTGSLRQNLALDAAIAQSGMAVFPAFALDQALHLSFGHLFWFGPLLGSGLGALGGLAGRVLAKDRIFLLG